MKPSRLSLAREAGLFAPPEGRVLVFGAGAESDLSVFAPDQVVAVQPNRPDHEALVARGYEVRIDAPAEGAAAALVILPRARAEAQAMIARARALSRGEVLVDGQKDAGADAIYKAVRARTAVSPAWSKAHGKFFVIAPGGDDFADWLPPAQPVPQPFGFVTAPGVFSADGVDPASRLLADALPQDLGAHVVDLGAGWGYLARRLLERDGLRHLDLVEANHVALDCARRNIDDARAHFHWADATTWRAQTAADTVVMNPPFHSGRAAAPALGRAFIASAAAVLSPRGRLFMVANRHLPYEAALREHFADVEELPGDNRFKIFSAGRPARARR